MAREPLSDGRLDQVLRQLGKVETALQELDHHHGRETRRRTGQPPDGEGLLMAAPAVPDGPSFENVSDNSAAAKMAPLRIQVPGAGGYSADGQKDESGRRHETRKRTRRADEAELDSSAARRCSRMQDRGVGDYSPRDTDELRETLATNCSDEALMAVGLLLGTVGGHTINELDAEARMAQVCTSAPLGLCPQVTFGVMRAVGLLGDVQPGAEDPAADEGVNTVLPTQSFCEALIGQAAQVTSEPFGLLHDLPPPRLPEPPPKPESAEETKLVAMDGLAADADRQVRFNAFSALLHDVIPRLNLLPLESERPEREPGRAGWGEGRHGHRRSPLRTRGRRAGGCSSTGLG